MPRSSQFKLLVLVCLGILVGCCPSEPSGSVAEASFEYYTALAAYERIKPAMLDWSEDAIVVGIFATSKVCQQTEWQIENTGTAACWYFEVSSPGTEKGVNVCLKTGEIVVGIDCIAGFEKPMLTDQELPLADMIDTDELMQIVRDGGLGEDYRIEKIRTTCYDSSVDQVVPPSWELVYVSDDDEALHKHVFVDAVAGEILRNDFVGP